MLFTTISDVACSSSGLGTHPTRLARSANASPSATARTSIESSMPNPTDGGPGAHVSIHLLFFTTNKHPNRRGALLHDDDLAEAIVDRILERGRLLRLDGPSLRTKHLPADELADDLRDRRIFLAGSRADYAQIVHLNPGV
jgi:hypothetical protein